MSHLIVSRSSLVMGLAFLLFGCNVPTNVAYTYNKRTSTYNCSLVNAVYKIPLTSLQSNLIDTNAVYIHDTKSTPAIYYVLRFHSDGWVDDVYTNGSLNFVDEDFQLPDSSCNKGRYTLIDDNIVIERFYPPSATARRYVSVKSYGEVVGEVLKIGDPGQLFDRNSYVKSKVYRFENGKLIKTQ